MRVLKWGIIGCGDVTEKKSGPAFNKVPDSKLVAVMRRDPAKAADYAKRHGVPKWYNDANELINDPEVDAVYVATPPSSHKAYTLAALAAGKPVYVEKPMAMTADECRMMDAASRASGIKLSVAHYRRELPWFKKVKEMVDNKEIGDIRFASLKMYQPFDPPVVSKTEVNWRVDPAVSGGGIFHDLAPHQIDLMLYYFGKPVAYNGLSTNQAKMHNADDIVSGQILFENGVVFTGLWSFAVPGEEAKDLCTIIGEHGKIEFPVFGNFINVTRSGITERLDFDAPAHVQQAMIAEVVQFFLSKRSNPCEATHGIAAMEIIDAFTRKK